MDNIIQILEERDMLDTVTTQDLRELLKTPTRLYCGFDPSADGLHLGSMVPIMVLAWFQRCGHTPFVLVGGATGMIGDPTGKSEERVLLNEKQLEGNVKGVSRDLKTILTADPTLPQPHFLNNYDWFKEFSFLEVLRDVGKYFRVGQMLSKESCRARMDSEEGMSFTEFSYQLLQGYDFLHLYKRYGVTLQIGGSDQWGNITAGTDLVKKATGNSVHGLTVPLLLRSDGKKFGKSEKGAIWMSEEKLSPYEFYQYLVRVEDRDVIPLLKRLTFLPIDDILAIEHAMQKEDYPANKAQRILAEEVTKIVHGNMGLDKALKATELMNPGKVGSRVTENDIQMLLNDVPSAQLKYDDVVEQKGLDIIVKTAFQKSKGDVRRLIKNGGLYLNGEKIENENFAICPADILGGKYILFAFGKKNKAIVEVL